MNFLSHFYFTKRNHDPYYSLGSILPDLLKNHNSSLRLKPEGKLSELNINPNYRSILNGWDLHITTDKHFHSSDYFEQETSALRKKLVPIFTRLPIRPFFLAHVGYELTLDSLLIQNKLVDTNDFYNRIKECSPGVINTFLTLCDMENASDFSEFLNSFIQSRYLESYNKPENIVYALDRIGRRVWQEKFTSYEIDQSFYVFKDLKDSLDNSFIEVFHYLEKTL